MTVFDLIQALEGMEPDYTIVDWSTPEWKPIEIFINDEDKQIGLRFEEHP